MNSSAMNIFGASSFGGVKWSGLGRTGGKRGILEWTNLKTVLSLPHDPPPEPPV